MVKRVDVRETTSTPKFLAGESSWRFILEEKWNSLSLGLLIPQSSEKCDFCWLKINAPDRSYVQRLLRKQLVVAIFKRMLI